jgi:hypothetical protein
MNPNKPNAAGAAIADFGLRREAKRHAAFGRNRVVRKAMSPLCSATAVQILAGRARTLVIGLRMPVLGARTADRHGCWCSFEFIRG